MADGSHGTHVSSIAAGKSGVCPEADIAAVLISLPESDFERRKSFYDSSRLIHAMEYLLALADKRHQPISINVSLGTNGHAHDASSALNRWIDSALTVPGRCVTVAAGNAGQEAPEFEGDRGFVMGRIHTSGQIQSRELYTDIEWLVVGSGIVDISENELEIWYGAQDRLTVSLRTPSGLWIGPVEPLQFIENSQIPEGSFVSIYNELYHPANGSNYISIYLSPFYTQQGPVGIPAGKWTVRLEGKEVRDGSFHGWIERDDPRPRGRAGSDEAWNFPSFFSERSNVDRSSVSSLACALNVISVANLDDARERIHITSSQGPTRDGRFKPDVAAPGTDIIAARGFSSGNKWIGMTGTSMASPHVTGLIGLLLATEPTLTAAQINGIIQRTSRPLPGGTFSWAHDAGFGKLQENACLTEASVINSRKDLFPRGKLISSNRRKDK
jgi:subtilisin family serine protease